MTSQQRVTRINWMFYRFLNSPKAFGSAAKMVSHASRDQQLQVLFKRSPKIILGSESASRKGKTSPAWSFIRDFLHDTNPSGCLALAILNFQRICTDLVAIMDELASRYGFDYETAKAAIDESAIGNRKSQPGELVLLLARAKAEAIRKKNLSATEGFLLTCDQVIFWDQPCNVPPRLSLRLVQTICFFLTIILHRSAEICTTYLLCSIQKWWCHLLMITVPQVVVHNGNILEKPKNKTEVRLDLLWKLTTHSTPQWPLRLSKSMWMLCMLNKLQIWCLPLNRPIQSTWGIAHCYSFPAALMIFKLHKKAMPELDTLRPNFRAFSAFTRSIRGRLCWMVLIEGSTGIAISKRVWSKPSQHRR